MRALTEKQVRRSFVNCSRGEADALTLPRTFAETPWEEIVVLGWRDPRAPLRGYLVVERDGGPVGVAVRAADTRMSSGTPAMCLLCQTAQAGSDVSLFTARRVGEAGRNGNTVGTYVCADLACARPGAHRDPAVAARARPGGGRRRAHRRAGAAAARLPGRRPALTSAGSAVSHGSGPVSVRDRRSRAVAVVFRRRRAGAARRPVGPPGAGAAGRPRPPWPGR